MKKVGIEFHIHVTKKQKSISRCPRSCQQRSGFEASTAAEWLVQQYFEPGFFSIIIMWEGDRKKKKKKKKILLLSD
jgi:hypothetical protein